MASSVMSSCDTCGWMAAVGGMLAFGSFGVPIKSKVAQMVDIDPLAMQTYKTSMCFLTSWLVLLYGEEFSFTAWGFVSGLFWVPGGIATIFAIQNAGLAIGIGVGSSFIVLVSFTWGIFVFDEHVHSRYDACFAVGCMMTGLLGMAVFSAPRSSSGIIEEDIELINEEAPLDHDVNEPLSSSDYYRLENQEPEEVADTEDRSGQVDVDDTQEDEEALLCENVSGVLEESVEESINEDSHIWILGINISRRTLGILSAMFSGIYGGSLMVPMKYAPDDAKGIGFLISFAIGAASVTLALWIVRGLYLSHKLQSFSEGYKALPSMHLEKMWKYGALCGFLWSIGNFFSILSVVYLGEGVGYSLTQSSILISGLWGIFYFKEIRGRETIIKWMLSASITVLGILLLSYEHHEK